MNNPCGECPFTSKSLKGFLPGYGEAIRFHAFIMNEVHFPCHMQLPKDKELITFSEAKKFQRCRGSIIYMKKACKFPADKKLRLLLNEVTEEEKALVMSVPEFLDHHKELIEQ